MNTFKQILKVNAWYYILIILLSQAWGYLNLILIAIYHRSELALNEPAAALCMLFLYLIVSYNSVRTVMELRLFNNYQLPASLLHKYLIALGTTVGLVIACLLFSMAVEYAGSILTTDYPVDKQIEVGGYIGYIFRETRYFTLMPILIGVNMILALLVRNKTFCFLFSGAWGYVFHLNIIHLEKVTTTPIQECLFAAIGIVLLTIGYQIYKRWQPANSGLLMI